MNLFKKIESALAMPGIKLLGQIPFSEVEYKELIVQTQKKVSDLTIRSLVPIDIELSVALVQIAIREYSEGNYWEYFKEAMDCCLPETRISYIGKVFLVTLDRYKLFQIERQHQTRCAYVENIKAHAFVPNNYLSGYIDFLFAYYDYNLMRQLPDDIQDAYSEMSGYFSETLSDEGDCIRITDSENKPQRSYKLLKATRALFAQGDRTVLSGIVYEHLSMIDDYYYDGKEPSDDNRFRKAFLEWTAEKKGTVIANDGKQRTKRHSDVFYHRPYLRVDRKKGQAMLIVPKQKLRNEDLSGIASAVVTINAKSIHKTLDMFQAFGVLVSQEMNIPTDDIFSEILVAIQPTTNKPFRIPARPYRIFDEDFFEMLKLHSGKNYLLTKKGCKVNGTKATYTNFSWQGWDEYFYSDLDDEAIIYIDGCPLSMKNDFIVGAHYFYISKEYQLLDDDNIVQTAYRHPDISLKVSRKALDGCFIVCNGFRFSAKENAASRIELLTDAESYGITIRLGEILDKKDHAYRILLDEPGKPLKEICRYVLITALRCSAEKERYIFEQEAILSVSGDYDIKPINCKWVNGTGNYTLDLTTGAENADFSLRLDDHDYTVRVPLQVFKHGFEGGLSSSLPEYVWHSDIKNILSISMPGAKAASAYLCGTPQIEVTGIPKGDGVFVFDITEIANAIRVNRQAESHISIKYTDNKERKLPLYRVLNRLYVERINVCFGENDQAAVDAKYLGKNDLIIRFCKEGIPDVIAERKVVNGTTEFPELTAEGLYTMYLFEAEPDPFGFGQALTPIGAEKHMIGMINANDISNCRIEIRQVSLYGESQNLKFVYSIIRLEKYDTYAYTGTFAERPMFSSSENPSSTHSLLGTVLIECEPHGTGLSILNLQSMYDVDAYDPLFYDKKQRRLVRSDSEMDNAAYSRYEPLYNDRAEYSIEIRRTK